MGERPVRRIARAGLFVVALQLVPHRLAASDAIPFFDGDVAATAPLERAVAELVAQPLSRHDFPTGSPVLNGEWLFATFMMAGMGFG